MPKHHSLSKWFGGGRYHVLRYDNSPTLLFKREGKPIGHATYCDRKREFTRYGVTYRTLSALLRAVENEEQK